jgi:hypothetical protein
MERAFGFEGHHEAPLRGPRGRRLAADQIEHLVNGSVGWHALHELPGTALAGVDHVIIGSCGVVAVRVEDHPRGRVWVGGDTVIINGDRADSITVSRAAASRIAASLSAAVGYDVPVTAYVVTVGAELRVRQQPAGVGVCTRLELADRLRHRPALLGPGHVEELYSAACRDETWQTSRPSLA